MNDVRRAVERKSQSSRRSKPKAERENRSRVAKHNRRYTEERQAIETTTPQQEPKRKGRNQLTIRIEDADKSGWKESYLGS